VWIYRCIVWQTNFQPDLGQKSNGLLVKKWTSVIRMQKKVRSLIGSTPRHTLIVVVVEDNGLGSSVTGSTARQLEHGSSPVRFQQKK
jgi:hypothetical protein